LTQKFIVSVGSSTFLIGGFNDRPTARDNAAFAYSVYQISDAALLMAAAFSTGVGADNPQAQGVAAFGLIVAASIKSSQFPLSGLFLRSMEGASPNSALGYAGISAHAGVVLLAGTMPMWFQFEWARALLAATGALTTPPGPAAVEAAAAVVERRGRGRRGDLVVVAPEQLLLRVR
jgi:NADH:ubiquinone oxidoreductase subunit 5 (subunit L)/multisubunit Na+/H+ antiporter MnhA subunit